MNDLRTIIDAHFDDGVPLSPELLAAIACDAEAQRHYDRLNRLEADLWNLPLEQPAADLCARVRHRIDAQPAAQPPWADLFAVLGLVAAAVAAWRWIPPLGVELYGLWQGIVDALPAQPGLVLPESLRTLAAAAPSVSWQGAAAALPDFSPLAAGLLAGAGVVALVLFNSLEAARNRGRFGHTRKGA